MGCSEVVSVKAVGILDVGCWRVASYWLSVVSILLVNLLTYLLIYLLTNNTPYFDK